ncbi:MULTISPECIES: hypothetical protein [unclassified Micromonospora]|uniref:hypothetical protein n=1 Tax=unclassified Micromonospora TaxID=2617518 RepID=UPI001C24BF9C|nr:MULTISPECIES: hypothetical protein [unclassified Micromonospora]MBU8857180.1 hypothetical protein [Micromonospora sp. WMMB482]MDM4782800.1 hypothetical protein [Micromonospora sp. b486]
MTITLSIGRRVAVGLAGAALALTTAAPAVAAPTAAEAAADISVGRLVLEPTARGYQGKLPVTVTNNGPTATYFFVDVLEPVAASFRALDPEEACGFQPLRDNRRTVSCGVPGGDIEPGGSRSFSIAFEVLTPTRGVAMIATGGRISVNVGDGRAEIADRARFAARFRSASGSLRNPVPYVQDDQARAAVTAAGSVTLSRQDDGSYLGRLPVTVRWAGDAGYDYLLARSVGLPAGVLVWGTDPQDAPSNLTSFIVPGGRFMAGEQRSFDVLLYAEPGAAPGFLGTVTFELETRWDSITVPEADPADNVVSVDLTIAG